MKLVVELGTRLEVRRLSFMLAHGVEVLPHLAQLRIRTIQLWMAAHQAEAEAARTKEITGVIGRIKVALDHYGLTPEDIFGKARAMPAAPKGEAATGARAAKAGKHDKAPKVKAKRKPAKAAKTVNPPKYADGTGRTWTGNGQRPGWFKDALASGKTESDLLIKR